MLNIPTGISLITGVPGSGKSFWCVERVLDCVRKARRPVYTNLPLKWRVIKLWLKKKEGDDVAGLIRPITETSFQRFLDRFVARQRFLDEHAHLGRRAGRNAFYNNFGPDIIEGRDLNWIPAGAFIVIDEAHHWYPNPALSNVRKREPEALMSYLTMHRHLMHRVFFVTQADRQVSSTIKSLLQDQISVERIDADVPMIGLRFSELGFVAFHIREWDGIADPEQEPPLRESWIFPALPWNRYIFRVYSSFTHMGSLRELKKELAHVQSTSVIALQQAEKEVTAFMRFRKKMIVFFMILCSGCGVGIFIQALSGPERVETAVKSDEALPLPDIKVVGFTDNGVIVDDEGKTQTLAKGVRFKGLDIKSVDRKNKYFIATDSKGEIWMFRDGVFRTFGHTFTIANQLRQQLEEGRERLESGPSGGNTGAPDGASTRASSGGEDGSSGSGDGGGDGRDGVPGPE